ncbi:hypothetical protein NKR23_g2158 [Pleurostoma richardsiae]|uniref:Uncharacterized protein n=1 Tax=Pleurostoma richardsiae TaxID=41990 RepID=A0AA38S2A0_9PEZI|nr:hypothetical protein NKR23_g2158 [Pleurostoma richardsiae]
METTYSVLISLLTVVLVFAGAWFAYEQGYLDPVIEKIGVYMMKAKAKAEQKKLQAQGLKEGEDFVDSQLKGNQQAAQLQEGIGGLGGLKKNL